MSDIEERSFPTELLNKRIKSTVSLHGWKFEDIPQVINTCRESGLAILDGKTEFFLPDDTFELYWLRVRLTLKTPEESWEQFVERTCNEFYPFFKEFYETTDFEKEALHSFDAIKKKKEAGINILDYLCFELGIISESRYLTLFR